MFREDSATVAHVGVAKYGAMRWGQVLTKTDKRPQLAKGTMKRNNSGSVFSA
jgi:hypothetical protein